MLHMGAGADCERFPGARPQTQRRLDGVRQRLRITRRNVPAGAKARLNARRGQHGFGRRAQSGDDGGNAHRLRLHRHASERFGLRRGHRHHGGGEQGRRHIRAMADNPHDAAQPGVGDARFKLGAVGAAALLIARQNEPRLLQTALHEDFRSVNQHFLAFPARKARRQQHNRLVRRHTPRLAYRMHAGNIHMIRRQLLHIGAARNDAQLFARPGMQQPYLFGGPVRIGDHQIGARHHGIIQKLGSRAAIISAVPCGDEGDARPARRSQSHPGRSARAGVDKVHRLGADDITQAPHIQRHAQRIFGRRWKFDPHAALGLQFADEPSAPARDQRTRARLRQSRRNVDRGALGAPCIEIGNDLEDGAACQRFEIGGPGGHGGQTSVSRLMRRWKRLRLEGVWACA